MTEEKLNGYFKKAFKEAASALTKKQGGPFGALVVKKGKIISSAHNTVLKEKDPTCHAEVNALRRASRILKNPHLKGCVLIATSEPCPMCLAAAYWANVDKIYYCLPKEVASKYGFNDGFIYKDLALPAKKRKLGAVRSGGLEKEGMEIFKKWKNKKGKIY
jgi:tRNA(Arg) A34 adenosine deaminase TadA